MSLMSSPPGCLKFRNPGDTSEGAAPERLTQKNEDTCRKLGIELSKKEVQPQISEDSFSKMLSQLLLFFSRSLIKNIHICRTSPSSSSSFYDLKLRYECRKELLSIDSVGLFFFAEARTLEAEAEARDSLSGFPVKQKPLPSMYGILTYIYHKILPNVGIYIPYMDGVGKSWWFFLLLVQWLEIWWANQNGVCQNCQGYSFFGIFAESMGQRAPQIICSRRQWGCRRWLGCHDTSLYKKPLTYFGSQVDEESRDEQSWTE